MCKYAYTIFLSAIIWADLESISGNSWWHNLCNQRKKFSISLNNTSSAKPADLCILSMEKVAISQFQADCNHQRSKLMAPSVSSEKIFQFQLIYTSSAKLADSCIFPWKKCQTRQFWTDLLPSALMADGPICTQWENVSKMLIAFI